MKKKSSVVDVFLSTPASSKRESEQVAESLARAGWNVFRTERDVVGDFRDSVRSAIAEAGAVVFVLDRDSMTSPAMMFELGAAFGWNKSVFPVLVGVHPQTLPSLLRDQPLFDIARLSSLIDAIKAIAEPFTPDEQTRLALLYSKSPYSLDELLQRPGLAAQLVRSFNSGPTRPRASGERVLRELLRLRKLGKLKRLTK